MEEKSSWQGIKICRAIIWQLPKTNALNKFIIQSLPKLTESYPWHNSFITLNLFAISLLNFKFFWVTKLLVPLCYILHLLLTPSNGHHHYIFCLFLAALSEHKTISEPSALQSIYFIPNSLSYSNALHLRKKIFFSVSSIFLLLFSNIICVQGEIPKWNYESILYIHHRVHKHNGILRTTMIRTLALFLFRSLSLTLFLSPLCPSYTQTCTYTYKLYINQFNTGLCNRGSSKTRVNNDLGETILYDFIQIVVYMYIICMWCGDT